MALYEFFTSRNNSANAASFVGQAGRLFYDGSNGVIKLSDGVTPGGTFIPYNIATASTIGGIKAGPGANVAVDGTLTIDTAGLPLGIGNLQINNTTLSVVNVNDDLILASSGTGNVNIVGNLNVYKTDGNIDSRQPEFSIASDGQVRIRVPSTDPLLGAVEIIGSNSSATVAPAVAGVMLHVTGNNNEFSTIYNDGINNFSNYIGRRYNGMATAPTAVLAGNTICRFSGTGYGATTFAAGASASIGMVALENFTDSAQGTKIEFYAAPVGSITRQTVANISVADGITTTKATVQGNLTVGGVVASNLSVTGTVTTPRVVINDGGLRTILDGIWANLNFASDSIVHLYHPSGDVTVNLNGHTAGATIRLLINMATARAVSLGVSATNSTIGATQLASNKIVNNQAVQIVYTCIDGTSGNTHAAVSYV